MYENLEIINSVARCSRSFHSHMQTRFQLCCVCNITVEICNSPSVASFKKHLKTHHCTCAFD